MTAFFESLLIAHNIPGLNQPPRLPITTWLTWGHQHPPHMLHCARLLSEKKKSPFLSHENFWYLGHFHVLKQLRKTKYQSFNRAIHTFFCIIVPSPYRTMQRISSAGRKTKFFVYFRQRQPLAVLQLALPSSSWKEMFRCMRLQHSQGPKCTGFLSSEWIYLLNSSHRCPQ